MTMGPSSAFGPAADTRTFTTTMSDGQYYHHQEEVQVAVANVSFDETSSVREDFLLVLVSSMSGSVSQIKNQTRAMTILDGCGIRPEVLDAADPSNAMVRDELCELSGIRGHYPQFFLVQGDQTTFFADFEELEHMNEEGTLMEWLGVEIPSPPSPKERSATRRQMPQNEENEYYNEDSQEQLHGPSKQELTTVLSVAEDTTAATSMVESLQYDVPQDDDLDVEWLKQRQFLEQIFGGGQPMYAEDDQSPSYGTYHPPDDEYCSETEENLEAPSPFVQDPQRGDDSLEDHHKERDNEEMPEYEFPHQLQEEQLETLPRKTDKRSDRYQDETDQEPAPPAVRTLNRSGESSMRQSHHEQAVAHLTQNSQRRLAATIPPASTSSSPPRNENVVDPEQRLQQTPPVISHSLGRRVPEPGSWEANFGSPYSLRHGWETEFDPCSVESESPNSIFDDILLEDALTKKKQQSNGTPNLHDQYDVPTLQTLQSILSCDDDDTVDTTATSSSIVTSTRVTSMDLDLRIQPDEEAHFWLSEDTPHCTITLFNMSTSYLPLAFKIQASHRRRYMVWPCVGVVKPQCSMSISVFIVEDAKRELLNLFDKLGPAAEFRQQDSLTIEWCGVPTDFCNQLTDDHDADLETLSSYWNTCRKNEGWTSEQSFLRVRVSVNDKDQSSAHRGRIQPAKQDTPTRSGDNCIVSSSRPNAQYGGPREIVAAVSMQSETEQLLQAEVENLRKKCEELSAERLIMERQLEEARVRQSLPRSGVIHKYQLQQTMRCAGCLQVFKSEPSSLNAPITSQSCGHSICRNCCYRRARAQRHSLSSDLLMCVGDLNQIRHRDDSCPICAAPNAFGGDRLHVNQSLCLVLKLLDG